MNSQRQRLFLKEKDYEMIKYKAQLQTKQSMHDPLINPTKKARANANSKNLLNKQQQQQQSNPLANINKNKNPLAASSSKLPLSSNIADNNNNRISTLNQSNDGGQPQTQIRVQTPWDKILASFIQSYDFMKERKDLRLANPFSSYGLKVEDQIKGIVAKDKDQERQRESTRTISFTGSKQQLQKSTTSTTATEDVINLLIAIQFQRTTIALKTYLKCIELMKRDLDLKWKADDKVGGLQIAIQACKLLHDNTHTVPTEFINNQLQRFQALKFAYVIEIVDKFGILVFQRIKRLSFPHLSDDERKDITLNSLKEINIPESAQEICRNWLLKIASIRELIPRTIIQTTLFRLHFFLNNGVKAHSVLQRLTKSNRCFGQYINCIFFSTFLIRIGRQAFPLNKDFILNILEDVFFYIKKGSTNYFKRIVETKFSRQDVDYDEFLSILEPFFISSFEALSESLEKEKFKRFMSIVPSNPHPIILKHIISSFSISYLTLHSADLIKMVQKASPQKQKYQLYKQVIQKFRGIVFPQSGQFIIVTWSDLSTLKDVQILLNLLGPFSEIIFRNLPRYQKNKFYTLILQSFSSLFDNFRGLSAKKVETFQKFLSDIIERTQDIKDVLTLQPFLQLISYFPTKSKQQISFNIAKAFTNRQEIGSSSSAQIRDPVVVHIMLGLMKNLSNYKIKGKNDEVQTLALKFIDKIDFGTELEEFLNFYGQMRASFGYLDKVAVSLIYKAAGLTFKARKMSNNRITNKLISFLQAAVAFCYITVPVIQSEALKLKMYLYISEVALANNLISQATSLIKTCITQLSETALPSDLQVYQIFFRIISFMIVMPDDPQKQYLFLFNGLHQAFEVSKFLTNHELMVRFQFYTNCITYLSCQAQEKLPFHLQGVVSNDGLFKSLEFKQALVQKIYQVFSQLQQTLKKMQKTKTNPQADSYIVQKMPQCLMTLIDTFEQSDKLKSIIDKSIMFLSSKVNSLGGVAGKKDNVLAATSTSTSLSSQKLKIIVDGMNNKLKENNMKQRIL